MKVQIAVEMNGADVAPERLREMADKLTEMGTAAAGFDAQREDLESYLRDLDRLAESIGRRKDMEIRIRFRPYDGEWYVSAFPDMGGTIQKNALAAIAELHGVVVEYVRTIASRKIEEAERASLALASLSATTPPSPPEASR